MLGILSSCDCSATTFSLEPTYGMTVPALSTALEITAFALVALTITIV